MPETQRWDLSLHEDSVTQSAVWIHQWLKSSTTQWDWLGLNGVKHCSSKHSNWLVWENCLEQSSKFSVLSLAVKEVVLWVQHQSKHGNSEWKQFLSQLVYVYWRHRLWSHLQMPPPSLNNVPLNRRRNVQALIIRLRLRHLICHSIERPCEALLGSGDKNGSCVAGHIGVQLQHFVIWPCVRKSVLVTLFWILRL